MKHSLYDLVDKALKESFGQIKLAQPEDHEAIHQLLESEGMVLSNTTVLRYTRRPDLVGSYQEAGWNPLILSSQEPGAFLGVISENEFYWAGQKRRIFYASDLRASQSVSREIRLSHRGAFAGVVKMVDPQALFFASILTQNERAMRAFAKSSIGLYRHEMCSYLLRSILLLPSIYLARRPSIDGLHLVSLARRPELKMELERFLEEEAKKSQFSEDPVASLMRRADPENEYMILRGHQIEGHVSLFRPQKRSIYVESSSKSLRFWIWLQSRFYGHDYTKKVPWVYVSSLMVRDALLQEKSLLPWLIGTLFQQKRLGLGELILMAHPVYPEPPPAFSEGEKSHFLLNCPQVNMPAAIFQITQSEHYQKPSGPIHLNPSML